MDSRIYDQNTLPQMNPGYYPQPKPKSKKGLFIAFAVLFILVTIGVLVYLFVIKKQDDDATELLDSLEAQNKTQTKTKKGPLDGPTLNGCYYYNSGPCTTKLEGFDDELFNKAMTKWWVKGWGETTEEECNTNAQFHQEKCPKLRASWLKVGDAWPSYGPQSPVKGCYLKTTNCKGDNVWHKDVQSGHYEYDWFTESKKDYLSEDGCNKRATEITSFYKCDNVEGLYISS